jgi:DNA repair protein RAD7
MEKLTNLQEIHLVSANLAGDETWRLFFEHFGPKLRMLKLEWIDHNLKNQTLSSIIRNCPELTTLKLKKLPGMDDDAVSAIADLKHLEHLSLEARQNIDPALIASVVRAVGKNLRTLTLKDLHDADDSLLDAIHETCHHLVKLKITDNDNISSPAYAKLFTDWRNPALTHVDFQKCRNTSQDKPHENVEDIGMTGEGFTALMNHSGERIEKVNVYANRHIDRKSLVNVFGSGRKYPRLRYMDVSFVEGVDDDVFESIDRNSPVLERVVVSTAIPP